MCRIWYKFDNFTVKKHFNFVLKVRCLTCVCIQFFSGEVQGKIHHVVVAKEKGNTIAKEKVVTSEKVTPSEEVDKGAKNLYDMKDSVVPIRRKDLDNFNGEYIISTGWFNVDHG